MTNRTANRVPVQLLVIATACATATATPELPDWTQATFTNASAATGNAYFPIVPGSVSVFEGFNGDEVERIESVVTGETVTVMGVRTRVVRDTEYTDGQLAEVTNDLYATDSQGNVWYFGEAVTNYNYDDDGNFIGTDTEGSWIADGVTQLPGIAMWASPALGHSYHQEYAPGVTLDFAIVSEYRDQFETEMGLFANVLNTLEGNLIDGPNIEESKFFAPGIGLVLTFELDEFGNPAYAIPLVEHAVPAPGAITLGAIALLVTRRRR